ncbi:sensor histidine kinase [Sedimentibacter sp.]|uniref:sensor histidine kinase n=1 Tax=Sedimentibacter sp. TaxID=1960295 RepID=UPI00289DC599|nr:sensor histidine kinase [Sedimentibacter sp.]
MREFFKVLFQYFAGKTVAIISAVIFVTVFIIIFSLYSLPVEPVLYAMLLAVMFILIVVLLDFIRFYKKHKELLRLKNNVTEVNIKINDSLNLIEKDYQDLIKIIHDNSVENINEKNKSYTDMMDYYTVWSHQIKTPISAMRLILQSEKSEINNELLEQLFKVEQYVEMALQYIRLDSLNSDLLFKKYSLDDIVKQAIRKYSKLFIRKKIVLVYDELNHTVLTDEKWVLFVVEQILSNALKYTHHGEIRIYMDPKLSDTLVIEDTGIGIEQEDLPRVFEKGFTGYNGREDKKSTGIGLYLCKQILNKLSHTITIESDTKKGTKVKIGLDVLDIDIE